METESYTFDVKIDLYFFYSQFKQTIYRSKDFFVAYRSIQTKLNTSSHKSDPIVKKVAEEITILNKKI